MDLSTIVDCIGDFPVDSTASLQICWSFLE